MNELVQQTLVNCLNFLKKIDKTLVLMGLIELQSRIEEAEVNERERAELMQPVSNRVWSEWRISIGPSRRRRSFRARRPANRGDPRTWDDVKIRQVAFERPLIAEVSAELKCKLPGASFRPRPFQRRHLSPTPFVLLLDPQPYTYMGALWLI